METNNFDTVNVTQKYNVIQIVSIYALRGVDQTPYLDQCQVTHTRTHIPRYKVINIIVGIKEDMKRDQTDIPSISASYFSVNI